LVVMSSPIEEIRCHSSGRDSIITGQPTATDPRGDCPAHRADLWEDR